MPDPIEVKAAGKNILFIKYDDGSEGEVPLTKVLQKEEFRGVTEDNKFSMVFIDPVTKDISWGGNAVLCKNALHKKLGLLNLMKSLGIDEGKI